MDVVVVPVLSDNFAYLLIDKSSREAAAIDPVEPKKVIEAAKQHDVKLRYLLTTHSHWDHAGGNSEFKRLVPHVTVLGGKGDDCDAAEDELWDDDELTLGSIHIQVLATPCHTPGHISFYCTAGDEKAVFPGDTLFIGGCGNFNQGTPEMMYKALYEKLGKLPDDTKVYCGHEYTVKNLMFAQSVEPDNQDIADKLAWAKATTRVGGHTVPSTIGEEKRINPFMRCEHPTVKKYCGTEDVVKTLATVRERKTAWGKSK